LFLFRSLDDLYSDSVDPGKSLLKLYISQSTQNSPEAVTPIDSLAAGDAHFSFIVSYIWPSSDLMEAYYSSVWSIRTDSRSLDDATSWIPLEVELSSLEDSSFVHIESAPQSELSILCVWNEEPVEFIRCVSSGWTTAALSKDRRAWLFPFGRAISMLPQIPSGVLPEFNDVYDISLGSSHIALIREYMRETEVWTFGLNDHGQRGRNDTQGVEPSTPWKKLVSKGNDGKIVQIVCGKWNTFVVIRTDAKLPTK